ncbi:hypothetical protein P3L10_011095 [Capsicum annuum]
MDENVDVYEEVDVENALIDNEDYWDIGDPIFECVHCGGYFWYEERINEKLKSKRPKFSLCCHHGKINLPKPKEPPPILRQLLFGSGPKSNQFKDNIRTYNSMFSFTSMGEKLNASINQTTGPKIFTLSGQNYYQIGSLLPPEGSTPKFAQLYIYDTENEEKNRIHALRLEKMLDDQNVLTKLFRMVRDRFQEDSHTNVRLKLIGKRNYDGKRYNLSIVSEIVALVVGDFEVSRCDKDIVVETQSGLLQRINELNSSYLALQYPLLFPYGEDGYREDIVLNEKDESSRGRKFISMREFFSYKIQERNGEVPIIVNSKRLFQKFLVDAFTMIESSRLKYIRTHQKKLRVAMYKGLEYAVLQGEIDPSHGKRVILSSSFNGGARYMIQNYQDAMEIYKWAGYPNLFITFTCNPMWPKIIRFLKSRGLQPKDRPDILSRVFKIKLDHLIKDLKEKQIFGRVKSVIYNI